MSKLIHLFFLFVFTCLVYADTPTSLLPVNWDGVDEIQEKRYDNALQKILSSPAPSDTTIKHYKLGVIHLGLGNHSKALFLFKLTAQKNPKLAPLAYEKIGDIQVILNKPKVALSAYRTVLQNSIPDQFRFSIFEKIQKCLGTDSDSLMDTPWLAEYFAWEKSREIVAKKPSSEIVDSLIESKAWASIDSLCDSLGKSERINACKFASRLSEHPSIDSFISTKHLFILGQTALTCKNNNAAKSLFSHFEKRSDVEKVIPQGERLYWKGRLYFALEQFESALKEYKKFDQKIGHDPDVVLAIARCYKKLGKKEESSKWYNRHLEYFPTHGRTPEILWLRAWQEEEFDNYKKAAHFYKQIITRFTKHERHTEACLRYALCFYKEEKYKEANNEFKKYMSNSNLVLTPSIKFWHAKTLLALDQKDSAISIFNQLTTLDPADYYSLRARQILILLGDTIQQRITFNLNMNEIMLKTWLDSIGGSSQKQMSTQDSLDYFRGAVLASMGEPTKAIWFIENLEKTYSGNLGFIYELIHLYAHTNLPERAFNQTRKLNWKIPSDIRKELPLCLYRILYPPYFSTQIELEADYNSIDPQLVRAVIRQESIFNPKIVSPAGAIGLMQLMPYTAKTVSEKINFPYKVDSLYFPAPNIRLGTFYLRELLNQFNDNLVMVLASYNAGPHNASEWYELNKDEEFDLFVEDIGFSETRGYVKKVLANYWVYRALAEISKM